ncbi:type II toxin-antitoxin system Phd/YefM family antitoxin [Desulfofundulus thermosubterraneus]|uniref:Antitoxin n=1 Tax=Desulfofundulus thermosubterraneus DSM 16057 TaxID=1121432 RepID=A0A1M6FS59_9FIRM|nr:type II toxin-antitoxin system prevent-host-death family antitoxin [Desulfofundulus thermosubterraneus]SHJ00522.1 prevent-host-death family protein [Desulfofundulus thermosubterraneus DSM 16057]
MKAGIREVKNRFSEYLRRVKQGEIIVITERNVPVARLVPVQEKGQLPVLTLVEEKLASWQGGKPRGAAVPPAVLGTASIATLVVEDRR